MIRNRRMTSQELPKVLDWAAAEGWNPGLDDAPAFFQSDPDGFFVADDDGELVAAISVVNHSDKFAFLGLYLCRPTHRGRGIGYGLWQMAISHAGERTIGLDGVEDQQANYAKSGFVRSGETTRYAGGLERRASELLRAAGADDIPRLIEAEAAASGWRKPEYLATWFAEGATRRSYVLDEDGGLPGFLTVRQCREGAKIGPFLAPDADAARVMLCHAASVFDGDIMIDVPSQSPSLAPVCAGLGLTAGFRTARMYRGPSSPAGADFFAVASLELG